MPLSPAVPATLLLALALVTPAAGQEVGGLPAYQSINPVVESRTGLYTQPFVPPATGWHGGVSLDYGSAIELDLQSGVGQYLLDAEILRLQLAIRHDLGPRWFAQSDLAVGHAGNGFMDGFFDWYHGLIGLDVAARHLRPRNRFGYHIALPDGRDLVRSPGAWLGDLRLTLGRRLNRNLQTAVSVTLPTGTRPAGYTRGTASYNLVNTLHAALAPAWVLEATLAAGYTPRHGDLSRYQETLFTLWATGVRYRFLGRASAYLSAHYHTPMYRGTGYPDLDRREITVDYGFILSTRGGEWRAGMTEDLAPTGPSIDAVFQFSRGW